MPTTPDSRRGGRRHRHPRRPTGRRDADVVSGGRHRGRIHHRLQDSLPEPDGDSSRDVATRAVKQAASASSGTPGPLEAWPMNSPATRWRLPTGREREGKASGKPRWGLLLPGSTGLCGAERGDRTVNSFRAGGRGGLRGRRCPGKHATLWRRATEGYHIGTVLLLGTSRGRPRHQDGEARARGLRHGRDAART